MFMPEPYHVVQEIQKYNLPDYRPRMEQFQKVRRLARLQFADVDLIVAGNQEGASRAAVTTESRLCVLSVRCRPFRLVDSL